MPIVIEELNAEVVPDARSESRRPEGREAGRQPKKIEDRVRALLTRERRRAERLSDR